MMRIEAGVRKYGGVGGCVPIWNFIKIRITKTREGRDIKLSDQELSWFPLHIQKF